MYKKTWFEKQCILLIFCAPYTKCKDCKIEITSLFCTIGSSKKLEWRITEVCSFEYSWECCMWQGNYIFHLIFQRTQAQLAHPPAMPKWQIIEGAPVEYLHPFFYNGEPKIKSCPSWFVACGLTSTSLLTYRLINYSKHVCINVTGVISLKLTSKCLL